MGKRKRSWKKGQRQGRRKKSGIVSGSYGKRRDKWDPENTKSDKFVAYYKAQRIVSEEEWDQFIAVLKTQLPLTFRINSGSPFASQVRRLLDTVYQYPGTQLMLDDKPISPPWTLPWYPDRNGWQFDMSRFKLRREPSLKGFHRMLVEETEVGTISRQEAVSMVPPFFLQVESHHIVLDMCAAPGSKTVQLLEFLHAGVSGIPEGLIVANDVDSSRAYMLAHQCKRVQSPAFVITCHEAQRFPNLNNTRLPGSKKARTFPAGPFDRVLADVPCSGDGTLRKAPDAWKSWKVAFGLGLHRLQIDIAWRGAILLKVGGLMVYSTCTFNPIENEAVVAQLLRQAGGTIVVEDASALLPTLRRRPGLSTWRVFGRGGVEFNSMDEVDPSFRSQIHPTMFPPTEEEAASMHLERCCRFLPHDQDTGGFFVTILRKVEALPKPKYLSKASLAAEAVAAERMAAEEAAEGAAEESKVEVLDDDAGKAEEEAGEAEKEGKDMDVEGEEEGMEPKKPKKHNPYRRKEHALYPFNDDAIWATLQEQYGLDDLPREQLYSRDAGFGRLNFLSKTTCREFVAKDDRKRLELVHTGVRVFRRNNKYWRLSQEGLPTILPYVTKRVLTASLDDFVKLLMPPSETRIALLSESLREALEPLDKGCYVLQLEDAVNPPTPELGEQLDLTHMSVVFFKGAYLMNLNCKQLMATSILRQLRGVYGEEAVPPVPVTTNKRLKQAGDGKSSEDGEGGEAGEAEAAAPAAEGDAAVSSADAAAAAAAAAVADVEESKEEAAE